jgi:hypothetical protein
MEFVFSINRWLLRRKVYSNELIIVIGHYQSYQELAQDFCLVSKDESSLPT